MLSKKFSTSNTLLNFSADSSISGQLDQYKTRIIINHDGSNAWYIPTIVLSGCGINIRYFPFDYQKCVLKFGSWTYLGNELNLTMTDSDLDMKQYLPSSQFFITKTAVKRNEQLYP